MALIITAPRSKGEACMSFENVMSDYRGGREGVSHQVPELMGHERKNIEQLKHGVFCVPHPVSPFTSPLKTVVTSYAERLGGHSG